MVAGRKVIQSKVSKLLVTIGNIFSGCLMHLPPTQSCSGALSRPTLRFSLIAHSPAIRTVSSAVIKDNNN